MTTTALVESHAGSHRGSLGGSGAAVGVDVVGELFDGVEARVDVSFKGSHGPVPGFGLDFDDSAPGLRQVREGGVAQLVEGAATAGGGEDRFGLTVGEAGSAGLGA